MPYSENWLAGAPRLVCLNPPEVRSGITLLSNAGQRKWTDPETGSSAIGRFPRSPTPAISLFTWPKAASSMDRITASILRVGPGYRHILSSGHASNFPEIAAPSVHTRPALRPDTLVTADVAPEPRAGRRGHAAGAAGSEEQQEGKTAKLSGAPECLKPDLGNSLQLLHISAWPLRLLGHPPFHQRPDGASFRYEGKPCAVAILIDNRRRATVPTPV